MQGSIFGESGALKAPFVSGRWSVRISGWLFSNLGQVQAHLVTPDSGKGTATDSRNHI